MTPFFESFGWILQKAEFICDMNTIQNYLEKRGKRVNFDNTAGEILTKGMREER